MTTTDIKHAKPGDKMGVFCIIPRKGSIQAQAAIASAKALCVAKVVSFAIRTHPLDSLAFLCCKSLTQNLRLLQRVLRQAHRGADSKSSVFTERNSLPDPELNLFAG